MDENDNKELEDWAGLAKLSQRSWTEDNPWDEDQAHLDSIREKSNEAKSNEASEEGQNTSEGYSIGNSKT